MDDDLRGLERTARERGDAPSHLAWAAALRRAGRPIEAAAAAFEARARGASFDETYPLASPPEGGGDACAPWPHPRGSSSGSGRSRVEGPSAGARVLFRVDLRGRMSFGASPLVLPDGGLVLALEQDEGTLVVALDRDGAPRWERRLPVHLSPLVATAGGELVGATAEHLVVLEATTGRDLGGAILRPHARLPDGSEPLAAPSRACTTWIRSIVVRESVVSPSGTSALRAPGAARIHVRGAPVALPDGRLYVAASAYRLGRPDAPGRAPPLLLHPLELFAFGREGELLWTRPLPPTPDAPSPSVVLAAGARRVHAIVHNHTATFDARTGEAIAEGSSGVPYVALDVRDQPIALAPFGPPLAAAPVVDAADRRYAVNRAGVLAGLSPEGETLFAIDLGAGRDAGADDRLAIGPGRLYVVRWDELISVGT